MPYPSPAPLRRFAAFAGSSLMLRLALWLTLLPGFSLGEDQVDWDPGDGRGVTRTAGVVVDYTGEKLTIQRPGGRIENLDATKVVAIQGDWGEALRGAEQALNRHEFAVASEGYRAAWANEKREWVRRRILAQSIWCLRHTGPFERTADLFLQLLRSDPTTIHFSAIPLTWQATRPSPAMEQKGSELLNVADSPAGQLIGASWLLSTSQRPAALATLQHLQGNADPRIALLAEAQNWRTQAAPKEDDVRRWEQTLGKLPADLQGGPSFVLGTALSRIGRSEDAALSFLRVSILFPRDRDV